MTPKHAPRKACCVGLSLLLCMALPAVASDASPETITEETAGRLVETAGYSATVGRATLLEFLSDDRLMVAGEYGGLIIALPSGTEVQRLDRSLGIGWILDVSSDATRIAVRSPGQALEIWNLDPLERVVELCAFPEARTPHTAFSPDGAKLATSGNMDCQIWETGTWERSYRVPGRYSGSYGLAFSPMARFSRSAGRRIGPTSGPWKHTVRRSSCGSPSRFPVSPSHRMGRCLPVRSPTP